MDWTASHKHECSNASVYSLPIDLTSVPKSWRHKLYGRGTPTEEFIYPTVPDPNLHGIDADVLQPPDEEEADVVGD